MKKILTFFLLTFNALFGTKSIIIKEFENKGCYSALLTFDNNPEKEEIEVFLNKAVDCNKEIALIEANGLIKPLKTLNIQCFKSKGKPYASAFYLFFESVKKGKKLNTPIIMLPWTLVGSANIPTQKDMLEIPKEIFCDDGPLTLKIELKNADRITLTIVEEAKDTSLEEAALLKMANDFFE